MTNKSGNSLSKQDFLKKIESKRSVLGEVSENMWKNVKVKLDKSRKIEKKYAIVSKKKVNYDYKAQPKIVMKKKPCQPDKSNLWYMCFGTPLSKLINIKDPLVCEGKVYKYKPGLANVYTERWMQLTQNGIIRIYKDHVQAKYNPTSPLVALPMSVISDIKKVHMRNKNIRSDMSIEKREKISLLNKNQFMLLYNDEAIKTIMGETDRVLKEEVTIIQKDQIDFTKTRKRNENTLTKYNYGKTQPTIKLRSIEEGKSKIIPSDQIVLTTNDVCHTPKMEDSCAEIPAGVLDNNEVAQSLLSKCHSRDRSSKNSWSSRQSDWVFNDKRLLFAAVDGESRRNWIHMFRLSMQTHTL